MSALVGFYVVLGLWAFTMVAFGAVVAQRDNARDELREAREELARRRCAGIQSR